MKKNIFASLNFAFIAGYFSAAFIAVISDTKNAGSIAALIALCFGLSVFGLTWLDDFLRRRKWREKMSLKKNILAMVESYRENKKNFVTKTAHDLFFRPDGLDDIRIIYESVHLNIIPTSDKLDFVKMCDEIYDEIHRLSNQTEIKKTA